MTASYPFTVDAVERVDGHWTATLTIYGTTYAVDRSVGSWRVTPKPDAKRWRELPYRYAAAIQERVRVIEKAERKEASDGGNHGT